MTPDEAYPAHSQRSDQRWGLFVSSNRMAIVNDTAAPHRAVQIAGHTRAEALEDALIYAPGAGGLTRL